MNQMVNLKQPETIEECLTLQSHFVGIPRITKKNHKEFHRRGKTLQALGLGFLEKEKCLAYRKFMITLIYLPMLRV